MKGLVSWFVFTLMPIFSPNVQSVSELVRFIESFNSFQVTKLLTRASGASDASVVISRDSEAVNEIRLSCI